MTSINWLNGTVLNVVFRWYKINRYLYQAEPKQNEKVSYCNVMIDSTWKGETCNHSSKYCTFYCEKSNDKCLPSPIYRSVNNISPIPPYEITKYAQYFNGKTFTSNNQKLSYVIRKEDVIKISEKKLNDNLPLCSTFYNGENMENYYKSIAMSEDDNSFAKIYQNYMKDIT
ncbi:hypothetical protein SNEBB_005240, partial [Seison nebaliae]